MRFQGGFMRASCAPARALSPPRSWRKMANYLDFVGLLVLGFCDFSACRSAFEHAMTCSNMFEHGYRGIHAQYHRYPYGPYGVFKARFLECFGGLASRETRPLLATPMK